MKKRIYKLFIALLSICLVGCGHKTISNDTEDNESKDETIETVKQSDVGYFVSYDNSVYYWKLNSDSRSTDGIFGKYSESDGAVNELVKVDSDGQETTILKDKGSKEIVISNDKIYTSYASNEYEERMIYSIDLNGENKQEIGKGTIKYVNDSRIIGTTDDNKIISIDLETDEYNELVSDVELLALRDDVIYYGTLNADTAVYTVYSMGETTDKLITVDSSDFEFGVTNIAYEKSLYVDNNIEIYLGFRTGTGNFLNGLVKVIIDSNNSATKESIDTSIYDDITDERIYYDYDNDSDESTIVYEDEDGQMTNLITESDFADKYGLSLNDETYLSIYGGNRVDDDVYFIVDYGSHNSSGDIGWRYSYIRNKTLYIKYNLNNKTFEKVYEF